MRNQNVSLAGIVVIGTAVAHNDGKSIQIESVCKKHEDFDRRIWMDLEKLTTFWPLASYQFHSQPRWPDYRARVYWPPPHSTYSAFARSRKWGSMYAHRLDKSHASRPPIQSIVARAKHARVLHANARANCHRPKTHRLSRSCPNVTESDPHRPMI